MKKSKLNFLILLTLIGLAVSAYLSFKHFEILIKGFQGPSFCSFNERFDCDTVLLSRFSKLGPFPLGGLGFVYYLYLLFAVLYARIAPDAAKPTLALPLIMTIPSVLFTVYLAFVSTFYLKTFCLLCLSLYAVTWIIFFLLSGAMEVSILKLPSFMTNYFKKSDRLGFKPNYFGNFLYAIVLMVVGLFVLYANQSKYAADFEDFDHKAFLDFHYVQTPVSIDTTNRPVFGNPNAPVKIVEFSDFECPFCKRAALNLKTRLKERKNEVQFIFFNYPLDQSCNPSMKHSMHQHACDAAKAALCANEQQKFWPYHDQLFINQPKFSPQQFKSYAKETGLDLQKFESCLASDSVKAKILADLESGNGLNVQGTPTIYVNGRLMKNWLNPVMMDLVIDEEIKRGKGK